MPILSLPNTGEPVNPLLFAMFVLTLFFVFLMVIFLNEKEP